METAIDTAPAHWTASRLPAGLLAMDLRYRLRARTKERLDRLKEGLVPFVLSRLAGSALLLAILSRIVKPPSLDWARIAWPAWMRLAGFPLLPALAARARWMYETLAGNLTRTVVARHNATLVTNGP